MQLCPQHRRDETRGQHIVGDPGLEHCCVCKLLIEVDRIYATRNFRKQNDVRICDGFGIGRCHADGKVSEIAALDIFSGGYGVYETLAFKRGQFALVPLFSIFRTEDKV